MADNQENIPNQNAPQQGPNYPPNYRPQGKKSRWWIPVSIVLGVLVIFFALVAGFIGFISSEFSFEKETVEVKEKSVLRVDLSDGAQEYVKQNPFDVFTGGSNQSSYFDLLRAIELAKDDNDIEGIYLNVTGNIGVAKSVEFTDKLKEFKESGKFIYSFIETGTESTYFNSVPADSIFMPLEGLLEFNGYSTSSLFFKGFFKKIGIEYHVEGWEDFKSAADQLNREGYSDSARYQLEVMLNQFQDALVNNVSEFRGIEKEKVYHMLNEGLFTADSIYAHGLVDGLMTETEVQNLIKQKLHPDKETDSLYYEDVEFISVNKYLKGYNKKMDDDEVEDKMIAIVNGVGPISSGSNEGGFGSDDYNIKSKSFIKELRKAAEDEDVDAIIVRIDSPGGSVIASEEIWQEIQKAKKRKPVIASMSNVAASGGYYMAIACDKIIAHPETITGSIGVILAIPNFSGTLDKLDITADTISTTTSAQFLNPMFEYSDEDKMRLKNLSKNIYFRFLQKVADSRGMTVDEVRKVAKGRVWTGADAKKQGLVDELGGLEYAIDYVKDMLEVEEGKSVYVRTYPEKEDEMEAFLRALGFDSNVGAESKNVDWKEEIKEEFGPNIKNLLTNWNALSPEVQSQLRYAFHIYEISKSGEHTLMAMPTLLEIR